MPEPKVSNLPNGAKNLKDQKFSQKPEEKPPKEGINLIILGVGATVITLITTSISLFIYHASGDIYLDRSRPGFLPDEKEVEELESQTNNYKFSDSGPIDESALDEYLSHIKDYQSDLKDLPDPYPSHPLSDQSLGISADKPKDNPPQSE